MFTRMQAKAQKSSYYLVVHRITQLYKELYKTYVFDERIRIITRIFRTAIELYGLFEMSDSNQQIREKLAKSIINANKRLVPQIQERMLNKKEMDEEYMRMCKCIHFMNQCKKKYESVVG
jgi:hypothetical protein